MADYLITAKFEADINDLISGLDRVANSVSNMSLPKLDLSESESSVRGFGERIGDAFQNAGSYISGFGDKILWAGGLVATFSNQAKKALEPLNALGSEAFTIYVDVESGMTDIQRTTDLTDEELKRLERMILDFSKLAPVSLDDVFQAGDRAGKAGLRNADGVMRYIEVLTMLEAATDATMGSVSDSAGKFLNITTNNTGEFERDITALGSTLTYLGNNVNATEDEIMKMAQRVVSAGMMVGLTEAEVMALSAVMLDAGVQAERGGTAMSTTLSQMSTAVASGGDGLKAWAKIAGVTTSEFAATFRREPIEALRLFLGGVNQIHKSGGDVTATLSGIGIAGVRQVDVIRLLSLSLGNLDELVAGSTQEWRENAGGLSDNSALLEEYGRTMDTTASKIQVLKNRFQAMQAEIGENLIPVMERAMDNIEGIIDWFVNLDDGTKTLIGQIALIAPAVLTATGALGSIGFIVGMALKAVGGFVSGIGEAFGVLGKLGLKGGLIVGAVALIAYAIYSNWDKVKPVLEEWWGKIQEWWNNIRPTLEEAAEKVKLKLGEWWAAIQEWWNNIKPVLVSAAETVGEKLGQFYNAVKEKWDQIRPVLVSFAESAGQKLGEAAGAFTELWDKVKPPLDMFKEAGSAAFDKVTGAITWFWDQVSPILKEMGQWFMTEFESARTALSDFWEKAKPVLDELANDFSYVWDLVAGAFQTAWALIEPIIIAIGENLMGRFKEAWETIQVVWEQVKPALVSLATSFVLRFLTIWETIKSYVVPLMPIFQSVASIIGTVVGTIIRVLGVLWEGVQPILRSLFNLFGSVFNAIMGILNTFRAAVYVVIQKLAPYFQWLVDKVAPPLQEFAGWIRGVLDEAVEKLRSFVSSVSEFVSSVIDTITRFVDNIAGAFEPSEILEAVENVKGAITGWWSDVTQWFGETVQKVRDWLLDMKDKFTQGAGDLVDGFLSKITELPDKLWEKLTGLYDTVNQWSSELYEKFIGFGRDVISGFFEGITEKWDGLKDRVGSIWDGVKNGAKSALGIHSPSRELMVIGEQTMAGFYNGIEGQERSVNNMAESMLARLIQSYRSFAVTVKELVMDLGKARISIESDTSKAITTLYDRFTNFYLSKTKEFIPMVERLMIKHTEGWALYTKDVYTKIYNHIDVHLKKIYQVTNSAMKAIELRTRDAMNDIWSAVYPRLVSLSSATGTSMGLLERHARTAFSNVLKIAATSMSETIRIVVAGTQAIARAFNAMASPVVSAVTSTMSRALASAKATAAGFYQVGQQMSNGMISGVNSRSSAVASAARSVAKTAFTSAKNQLQIKSPSRLFHMLGEYSAEGMAGGLLDGEGGMAKVAQGLADTLLGSFGEFTDGAQTMGEIITRVMNDLATAIADSMKSAKNAFSGGSDMGAMLSYLTSANAGTSNVGWVGEMVQQQSMNAKQDVSPRGVMVIENHISIGGHEFDKFSQRVDESNMRRTRQAESYVGV